MPARPVLLVHGGWGGSWAWEKVVPGLEERGVTVDAVDLPLTSLEDDAAVVRDALDAAPAPTVVCGHSLRRRGRDCRVRRAPERRPSRVPVRLHARRW